MRVRPSAWPLTLTARKSCRHDGGCSRQGQQDRRGGGSERDADRTKNRTSAVRDMECVQQHSAAGRSPLQRSRPVPESSSRTFSRSGATPRMPRRHCQHVDVRQSAIVQFGIGGHIRRRLPEAVAQLCFRHPLRLPDVGEDRHGAGAPYVRRVHREVPAGWRPRQTTAPSMKPATRNICRSIPTPARRQFGRA